MLTVVYFSILQHKLIFLLPHDTSTDIFFVGVHTRYFKKVSPHLNNFTASHQVLILSAVIHCTLILSAVILCTLILSQAVIRVT